VTDFLDEKRQEITARLTELKPVVDEYNRLEAAASALAGVGGARSPSPAAAGSRGRRSGHARSSISRVPAPVATKPARNAGRRTRRRKGSGSRAAEALSFVQGQPGITIPELASKMGIKRNYLYRVLPGLEQEGKVKRQGRGWHGWDPKGP
jgi:hypothetical protein